MDGDRPQISLTAQFLKYPGLFPLAVLGQSANPAEMLRQVTQWVDQVESPIAQADLLSASAILAGLRLEQEVIHRLIRRDIMQESVIYRSIQSEFGIRSSEFWEPAIAFHEFGVRKSEVGDGK